MEPRTWVKSITFSDDTTITLKYDDVVIIVGSNNCGKTETLRAITSKISVHASTSVVVKEIVAQLDGTTDDIVNWLTTTAQRIESNVPADPSFEFLGSTVRQSQVQHIWQSGRGLNVLAGFFCRFLTAGDRLHAATTPNSLAFTRQGPQHPIHSLYRDDALEASLSHQFRIAFGSDLIVHRNAGNRVPLHVGLRPKPKAGQDRVSLEYVLEVEKLPELDSQGDGMRSFTAILLYTAVGRYTVLLIDEPEAFLHPPQARHLGRVLLGTGPSGVGASPHVATRQLFVATHSGDVLRGALDTESPRVRVIRLRRHGNVNHARELDNAAINKVWSDPLLRYSNILDGLFHEKVVAAEGDGDCRFFAAIMDAVSGSKSGSSPRRDIMFTHCGGKDRLPLVIRSLRSLDVPVAVVVDFDVLREQQPLRNIVESVGGDWNSVDADWRLVKSAVDAKKPELDTEEVKKDMEEILGKASGAIFPDSAKREIQAVLRRSSPWSTAKAGGLSFIPSGQPTQACSRLFDALETMGVFIVPVGELEKFCRSVGNHGPAWVAEVLKKDLALDPELEDARKFVAKIIA
jgi:energy-coupling factor transporter ATP-binding protein EcfA2